MFSPLRSFERPLVVEWQVAWHRCVRSLEAEFTSLYPFRSVALERGPDDRDRIPAILSRLPVADIRQW